MILFKIVILISFEQVSTESTVFSLQWECLSYSLLPHVVTSSSYAHFADSFVSITVFSSRVTSHCWGFTAVLTVLWCYCCYNHPGTIKITKDLVAPVFCSEHHLFPISPLEEESSAFPCLRQCSPISTHDSLESTFSSKSDISQIYHMHVSRPHGTCKFILPKSRATTSALFS